MARSRWQATAHQAQARETADEGRSTRGQVENVKSGYVVYDGRTYRIVSKFETDEIPHLRLRPLGFGGKPGKGTDIIVPASMVQPRQKSSVRHMKGSIPHRGRPVHLDIDTGAETIRVRLKGKRNGFDITFGGLYDLCARQSAMNEKRDRAFRKRTRSAR